jgi:S-formylglutathione hydrolase FrmB
MKGVKQFRLFGLLWFVLFNGIVSAQEMPFIKTKISVSPEVKSSFIKDGRLILHMTKVRGKEPRMGAEVTIGVTASDWDTKVAFTFTTKDKNVLVSGNLDGMIKSELCYFQVVYKQNLDDGQENIPGNLYSKVDSANISANMNIELNLSQLITQIEVINHRFIKPVVIKSRLLSEFSGYDRYLKAAILLPSGYFDNPGKTYPICYRAPGLNGRSYYINGLMTEKAFTDWWFSKDAPQMIYVFLDSQGPFGDTYQVDSENNGPCGKALTEELIPEIERLVRYDSKSHQRFLTGYSTGGWVALGLQIFYPDFFDGTWSYSPDPVDFEHFGLINMYADKSIFYNRFGYLQPGKRTVYGEPTRSMKDWIAAENVVSRTGNYLVSGGQFGAYNAVFSPKGKDGLPALAFDPFTGKIDPEIAKQWEKYDLKKILERNWTTVGPKLQGKIWIWTGDMDGLYSNIATRFLKDFLDKTENPKSDAKVSFTPMAGHCQEWNDKAALTLIGEKVSELKK